MKNENHAQSGFSLIELLIASLILTTAITVTINVFGINMLESSQNRNQLKASELARAKLDEYKEYARKAGINGSFSSIRTSSLAVAYNVSNTVTINNLPLTWRVEPFYCTQSGTIVADVALNTMTSKMLRLLATVNWYQSNNPKYVTMTTYVTDVTP